MYIISLIIIKQLHTQQKQHGNSTSNMKDFTRETSWNHLVLRPQTLEGIHCSNVGQGDTTSTNPGGITYVLAYPRFLGHKWELSPCLMIRHVSSPHDSHDSSTLISILMIN